MAKPEHIKVLANFVHEEILQLLWEHSMTEAQLADELGITRSAVGYHLKKLLQANLIYVSRREEEKHGIMQKYYRPIAAFITANHVTTPKEVRRYFIQRHIDFLRGVFTALTLRDTVVEVTPLTLERLAEEFAEQVLKASEPYVSQTLAGNVATLKLRILVDALRKLAQQEKWKTIFSTIL